MTSAITGNKNKPEEILIQPKPKRRKTEEAALKLLLSGKENQDPLSPHASNCPCHTCFPIVASPVSPIPFEFLTLAQKQVDEGLEVGIVLDPESVARILFEEKKSRAIYIK